MFWGEPLLLRFGERHAHTVAENKAIYGDALLEMRLPAADSLARSAFVRNNFDAIRAAYPVKYFSLAEYFCDSTWYQVEAAGQPLYSDDDHLSSVGADRLIALFQTIFQQPGSP